MSDLRQLQNEISVLRSNIYTLAYAIDDLARNLKGHDKEIDFLHYFVGSPKKRRRNVQNAPDEYAAAGKG